MLIIVTINFIRNNMSTNKYKYILLTFVILSSGKLLGHDYGFMYISNGTVESTGLSNTGWHTVGSGIGTGDDFTQGSVSNWEATTTVNNLKSITGGDGNYHIAFSLSFEGSVSNWEVGITLNGVAPTKTFKRNIDNANKDVGVVHGSVDVTISVGDAITLVVKPIANNSDFKPVYAQVTAVEALEVGGAPYGSMDIFEGATTVTNLGSAWQQITGLSAGDEMYGITLSSNKLVIGAGNGGAYFVSFHVSFIGDGTGSPLNQTIGTVIDGTNNDPTSIVISRKTRQTDVGVASGLGILDLSDGDEISLEMGSDTENTDITIKYLNIVLVKLGGTSATPPHASMDITSDQTVTVSASNIWYKVGTFSSGSLSGWSFSGDILTPILNSPSAGIYYIKYNLSFHSASATGIENILFGLFVGSGTDEKEHQDFTVERAISGSSDIGSIQGVGLISVSSADSVVSLKLKNLTNIHNITIDVANVDLYRITPIAHDGSLPVELTNFIVKNHVQGVSCKWITESEIENLGFTLERKTNETEWREVASYKTTDELLGQGTTSSYTDYKYLDVFVEPNTTYEYRLGDIDYNGVATYHSTREVTTIQNLQSSFLAGFEVLPAYPNPFNPSTTLTYGIDEDSKVTVQIYDITGQLITTLLNNKQQQGWHSTQWNGTNHKNEQVPAGIYLGRITSNNTTKTTKLMLLK